MSKLRACLLSVLFAGALALPAAAADTIDATNIETILELVQTFGPATLDATVDGDPLIVGQLNDKPFVVFFERCVEHVDCKFVSFYARWTNEQVTTEQMEGWNAIMQFSRGYFEQPGVEVVQMEVNMFGGVTPANFVDTLDWYRASLVSFQADVIDQVVTP